MLMKFDSNNVKLYMTIIQVYNDTLSHNVTIYVTITQFMVISIVMLMALTPALGATTAVDCHSYAISIAIYITINLGSQTCYI